MTAELADVTAGIHAAVHELADAGGLIDQLRDLLADKTVGAGPEVPTGHRPPGSRPPWDGPVSNAYLGVHAWARQAEADLGTYVHGRYWRRAGGTDYATREALRSVAVYCDDNRVPESEVRRVARHLGQLLRQCQRVPAIDTAPPAAAALGHVCPTCGTGELLADGTAIGCTNELCAGAWTRADWPALLRALGGL